MSITESILLYRLEDEIAALTARVKELERSIGNEAMDRLWKLESDQRNLKTWVTGRANKLGEKVNKFLASQGKEPIEDNG